MPSESKITVVVSRFGDVFAAGLGVLLSTDESIEVVATDIEHDRMPVVLSAHHPDVAILDADALEQPAQLRRLFARNPHTRLVLFAQDAAASVSAPLLAFGASACLDRNAHRNVLKAIHLAARGIQAAQRAVPLNSGHAAGSPHHLTPREAELLPMLQHGNSNAQIALALGVGVETVRTHAHNLYRKLGVSSRRELHSQPVEHEPGNATSSPHGGKDFAARSLGPRSLPLRARRRHDLRR